MSPKISLRILSNYHEGWMIIGPFTSPGTLYDTEEEALENVTDDENEFVTYGSIWGKNETIEFDYISQAVKHVMKNYFTEKVDISIKVRNDFRRVTIDDLKLLAITEDLVDRDS